MRSFGAYTRQVDQQCRPTIEVFVQYLQEAIQFACPDAHIVPYGSYATGLWLPTSDVDMVVQGAGSCGKRKSKRQNKKMKNNNTKNNNKNKKNNKNNKNNKNTEPISIASNEIMCDKNGNIIPPLLSNEPDYYLNSNHTFDQSDLHRQQQHEANQKEEEEEERTPEELLATAWEAFQRIYTQLSCQPWAENVIAVTTSRMPVIKLTLCDGFNQIPFDVTIDPGIRKDIPNEINPNLDLAIHR